MLTNPGRCEGWDEKKEVEKESVESCLIFFSFSGTLASFSYILPYLFFFKPPRHELFPLPFWTLMPGRKIFVIGHHVNQPVMDWPLLSIQPLSLVWPLSSDCLISLWEDRHFHKGRSPGTLRRPIPDTVFTCLQGYKQMRSSTFSQEGWGTLI